MQSSSSEPGGAAFGRNRSSLSFGVVIALVILGLSLAYALLFSRLVYVSLVEQHFDATHFRYRYEGPVHFHSPAEWFLLAMPAVIGWLGSIGSLSFLLQRWRRRPLGA